MLILYRRNRHNLKPQEKSPRKEEAEGDGSSLEGEGAGSFKKKQMNAIQGSIRPAVRVDSDVSEHSSGEGSDGEEVSPLPLPTFTSTPQHPRVGKKCPKQHAPPKCINVACEEEKRTMSNEIMALKAELSSRQKEVGKLIGHEEVHGMRMKG